MALHLLSGARREGEPIKTKLDLDVIGRMYFNYYKWHLKRFENSICAAVGFYESTRGAYVLFAEHAVKGSFVTVLAYAEVLRDSFYE